MIRITTRSAMQDDALSCATSLATTARLAVSTLFGASLDRRLLAHPNLLRCRAQVRAGIPLCNTNDAKRSTSRDVSACLIQGLRLP